VNWKHQYLVLAKGLAKQPFEGAERSAVSRAYYGAFNLSRRWLEANLTPIDNRGAHEQVWQTFLTADRASPATREIWILIGSLGESLHRLRNEADYDDRIEFGDDGASRAVETAERILALLPELQIAD
jgi:hypothetical protein